MTGHELERIARLETKVEHLTDKIDEMADDVRQMRDLLNQARGAKWILAALWIGFGGSVTAVIIKLFGMAGFKFGG